MTKKNLTKNSTQGTIQKTTSEDVITSFYGLDGAAAAIEASTFDLMEEMTMIIQHTRDPDPKVSLAALKQFRSVMKEVVNSNGMIGTIQQTEIVDENISRTLSSSTLLTNLRSQNDQIEDQNQTEALHQIIKAQNRSEKSEVPQTKSGRKDSSKSSKDANPNGVPPNGSTGNQGLGDL